MNAFGSVMEGSAPTAMAKEMDMKVVINGCGIDGSRLAHWSSKSGHELLLVEVSPQLLGGAYIIDFLDGRACRFPNRRTTIL